MAKLHGASATIQIIPDKREMPNSDWIDTTLILEYHLLNQIATLDFSGGDVCLRIEDFKQLFFGVREYLNALPSVADALRDKQLKRFHFSPLELAFDFEVAGSYYSNNGPGANSVYVTFDVALRVLSNAELVGDKIGCTIKVQVQDLLHFLSNLENEVNMLVDN